ncbi:MAG: ribosomal protein S18-alanine N-acetyltransferase [Dehalococcoidia bacterium]|nr:ribosomal protein S18-alanine N-acetyltransferase [Dehalococcoidia bacterium]
MAYCLRPLRREDIPQVTEIDLACFPTMLPPPNYQTEIINPLAHYLVAHDDEPPTKSALLPIPGFAGLWLLAGEAHVINLAVREAYRGMGLGELLFIGLIQQAQALQASLITLEVRVSNTVAQNLYEKYGLTERGRRRAYYADNSEDALIMTLDSPTSPTYGTNFRTLCRDYEWKWARDIQLRDD